MKPKQRWTRAVVGITACSCSVALIIAADQAPPATPEQGQAPITRGVAAAERAVDFQRDVRQILSDNCFQCHGPDSSTRRAGLRLDIQESAFAKRQNGTTVVPGDAENSLLYQRIATTDPARRMPPLSAHKSLSDSQKDTLKRWIAEGARWKQHWAFTTPVRPPLPSVTEPSWVRNPIDRFVRAKMQEAGLVPNPELDRRGLIRRVSLDLTGLPPTAEEVAGFVADRSPDAYRKVVRRLLASPHYGEHRARYWLDAARYADTNGLHYDNYRAGIWPYRDWVIKAFNRNLPFDQFTIEQLAGDLLPSPTLDQVIATGFARNNETTSENGIIEAEQQHIYIKDRADTTATVFLGLTVECATCHDHKFDPISQKDHYALEAFFNNTTERVMDLNRPDAPPIVYVPKASEAGRLADLLVQRTSIRQRMGAARNASNAAFDTWLDSRDRGQLVSSLTNAEILSVLTDGTRVSANGAAADLTLSSGVSLDEVSQWPGVSALKFTDGSSVKLPNVGYITGDEPFSIAAWIYLPNIALHPGVTGESGVVIASQMASAAKEPPPAVVDADAPPPAGNGWTIEIDEGVVALRLSGGDGKMMRARALYNEQIKEGTWSHVAFTYDGSRTEEGLSLFLNGAKAEIQRGGFGRQGAHIVRELKGTLKNNAPLQLGSSRAGRAPGFDGSLTELRIFNRVLGEQDVRIVAAMPLLRTAAEKPTANLNQSERDALKLSFLNSQDGQYQRLVTELNRLNLEIKSIEDRSDTAMVMEERKDSKAVAPLLHRGAYDQPRELLEAATPSALPPMRASLPRNRLGLAQWLVDPANPLLSRVTMNRAWQEFFGSGIVKTPGDFGAQSEAPSHPELLDWLAVEFRESGWDMKKMAELIVTSATYRQSGAITPEKLRTDPDNRSLSRGPRFRLDGEVVRDMALAASGLLVPELGGPPVKPYQPTGVWEGTSMADSNTRYYRQDAGAALYRRSLYTVWKRSAAPASMTIFDAPSREVCIVRRDRTNTPLQALALMNDPQFVEAARTLGQRALRASPGIFDRQLDFMTLRILARTLDPEERRIVTDVYNDFLRHYQRETGDAQKILAIGDSNPDPVLAVPESAALTMVANQLFSLDEALNK